MRELVFSENRFHQNRNSRKFRHSYENVERISLLMTQKGAQRLFSYLYCKVIAKYGCIEVW